MKYSSVLNLFKSGVNLFSGIQTGKFSYSSSFVQELKNDVSALRAFQQAVKNGTDTTTAISTAMQNASVAAKNYATNNKITQASIRDYITLQKQSQVTNLASSSSFKDQVAVIKAYNNSMQTTRLTQDQFREAVNASNPALGKYLNSVKAGEASTKGYIGSLIEAKIASIGLKIATVALNIALTSLISIGISAFARLITDAMNASKKSIEDAADSINELKNNLKTLDDYRDKIIELRTALDKGGLSIGDITNKRGELFEIQKQLIDGYGDEAKGIDFVTGSLKKQLQVYDTLKVKKQEQWLDDNRTGIQNAYNFLYSDKPDPAKNYLILDPRKEGFVSTGTPVNPTGVSKFLADWVSNNDNVVDEWEGAHKAGIRFIGNRMEILNAYDKLLDDLKTYESTQEGLTKQDKENIEALKTAISGAKKYITDNDSYDDSVQTYTQATEYVAKTRELYKNYYDDINKYQKEYDDAVIQGNDEAAKKSYAKVQSAYKNLFENGDFSQTLNGVRGEDVKQWFKDQQKDFAELSVPVRLKIDIEGTKREFDSSYEDLISMYSKVGDKGFVIGNVDYRGIPAGVEGYSDVTIAQASEFNAIRDAAKEAGVSIESYIEALVQYGKVQKKVAGTQTEELSITKYSEDIKKAQDAISPLLDAYNKLQKGELSNSDIVTLISDKFPSLIKYTDNLSVGIQKLASEKLEELKTKLNEVDRSKLSEDDLKAYDKFIEYIDKLNDGFSSTVAYYEKIQSQTKSVSDSITTLIGLSKEIDENGGLSLSSMEKILSDDSLTSLRPYLNDVKSMLPIINNLIDDQKQAYEDLYNEQQRLADPDAYIEASQEKQKEDENAFQNAVKRINEQINKFKEKYGVDLKNWEHIEDGKKSILQNTNAELLSKQWKLINDFGEYYNTDLKNFKDITEAKAAILENFGKSKAFAQIRDILIEDDSLGNNYGQLYISDEKSKKKINSILSASGLTWQDYLQYMQGGTFTKESDNALKKVFNEIVNAYTISPSTWNDATKSIGASGGSSGSSSSSKGKTWFEQQYAYHNHLVNMEQEKQQDYLNWLDSAYKQAYSQGIIDLDAYYKYEEEVYNGRKKLAGDTSNWFERQYKEHQHLLKMERQDEADYLKWLDSAYKKAYAEGLITLDDYRKYQEEVYEGIKKLKNNAESAIKELINIRINMLKEDVNKEKESINKRLELLKDFYQKQKDMLQDKYDKEKYLDEQSEKRKKVSDVQAKIATLRLDDSAKAQKRRAELAEDLKDAQKDLADFEKEHSLKTAQNQLDTLYENQEKEAKKKIETLEKKISSPQELYEQALADIRNGSQQLYNQMIKWNNVYGDGIRDTIKNAWEEAYKAEKQYFNYTGKHFNGVNLSNATGYIKGKTGYASGTSHSTAGLHRVDEQGIETIFQSADGQRYRMFSSGEKVLNATASDFLYKFANKGREILERLFNGTSRSYNNVNSGVVANNIQQGDIIIQGNADKATVSEIRRAQRESLEQMLKQLNRLK